MDAQYGVAAVGRRPDLDQALVDPASVFASPDEVVHDPSLSPDDKREILRRWAWDEWLQEVAADESPAPGKPSRYDEVKAALLMLDRLASTQLVFAGNTSPFNKSAA
ncbi:hypothetical protein [Microvirga mediterraneensis]|uniref:Uncharacterized protein n=1 Tax=Microvirga mediterraneensis TaxID=2754695 RepID=A0A838BUP5_9HYPH|nr:hypothetical protein [Microvirga mediterraneensis]MBA1158970.1 hypothetical protein [Microvirga mediterraneensis]